MIIFGIAGLIIISVALWTRKEKRQDVLFIIGGILLLAYSLLLRNAVFSVMQGVFIVSALLELIKLNKK